ncbi:uncharacterized protein LOC132204485 [Neocloeon triangulifer]|uniref:uncharacterized protein LOC132204485 n=1 Tax=Neocloeon triangulifer TaxID=2078957 RepID=UPI00286F7C4B|nr:uncharacterized protein LOC132204485 [Neocloeon triangulifer]XP_059488993.1 uncharacterized protein LOC132204485 [Neocloeon triangulifer]
MDDNLTMSSVDVDLLDLGSTVAPESLKPNCSVIHSQLPFDYGERGSSIHHEYPMLFVIPMAFILAVVSLASVVGNGLVVATIMRHRGMRTRTNLLLANLAAADILVGAVDMPFSLIALVKGRWVFGKNFCQFNAFTTGLALMASIHTLMFISIHKYISMTRPFSRAMTPLRISLMAASVWLWGTFYNSLPLFGMTSNVYKLGATQCGPIIPCERSEKIHSMINTLVNFGLPLIVMSFCNFKISSAVRDHMGRMRACSNVNYENSVLQQKHITVTLVIVMVCFLACWLPYIVYSCLLLSLSDKTKVPLYLNPVVYWCGYLNSACNPIIYAFRSPSFRQGYLEILCRRGKDGRLGLGSFYSGSASGKTKTASQRTYLSQYSRKTPRDGFKKNNCFARLNLETHPSKLNEVSVRHSLLPNSGIVAKAVLNHLKHRSQRIGVLKSSPSAPDLQVLFAQQNRHRPPMRRFDTDTCLLPTLTSGLDLMGHCEQDELERVCSFHTLPPEEEEDACLMATQDDDEAIPIVLYDENGEPRNIRTESGAFVVSLQDENGRLSGHVRVIVTDTDAISNTSLKTISRSFGEDLNLPQIERHRMSMLSLMEFGRNFDLDTVTPVAKKTDRRATHQILNPPLPQIKYRSDPGGLALRKFGSVERLGGERRRLRRGRAPPRERQDANVSTEELTSLPLGAERRHKGLLAAAGGGIRNSIMALFGKAGSVSNFAPTKM